MASCTTPQSPQSSSSPQFTLTVTENTSKSTSTTAWLDWTFAYVTHGYAIETSASHKYTLKIDGNTVRNASSVSLNGKYSFTIDSGSISVSKSTSARNVSFSIYVPWGVTWSGVYASTREASGTISIAAKTSYTVSFNANGGSGAPGSQTKWAGTTLTLSSTKPTRTGYTFSKWNTNSSGTGTSYSPGGSYTSNSSVTLYAIWIPNTYTVDYNLNGGSGAIANQTKTYNQTLILTSTTPSRVNYDFVKWNTKSDGTGIDYLPGASYTSNSAITLYAIWKLSCQKPTISNFTVIRCTDSSGTVIDEDNGTYAKIQFHWSCDQQSGSNNVTSITVNGDSVSASGTSGDVTIVKGPFSIDLSYNIQVIVIDTKTGGTGTTATKILPYKRYLIDFKSGGDGVSIGCPATQNEVFECAWEADFDDDVYVYGNLKTIGYIRGTHANEIVGDVLAFALACSSGVTPFITNASSTNIPNAQYQYSTGWVHKRTETQIDVYLKNYMNGILTTNTYVEGIWTGWQMTDPIVEQGTSGIWTYEKRASGIAKCWITTDQAFTGSATVAVSGLYYSGKSGIALPNGLFSSVPRVTVGGKLGSGIGWGFGWATRTDVNLYILGNHNSTAITVTYMSVEGKWN